MCVLALAWQAHPRWRLVLAANRDELHARPAAPLARWDGADHVLAGRDLLSGGTWLGVSEKGRLAVVTNLHTGTPQDPAAPSRGMLLRDILVDGREIEPSSPQALAAYNPFNLISIVGDRAVFAGNRPDPSAVGLASGVHGLSNATLNTPWPKTERLRAAVETWVRRDEARPEGLLDALADEQVAAGALTPAQTPAQTPIFIRNPIYGTRCSTVVAIDDAGNGLIVERRFTAEAQIAGETSLAFRWPTPI